MQDQDYQSQKKTGQVSKRERICRVNGINQVALARAVIDSMNLIVDPRDCRCWDSEQENKLLEEFHRSGSIRGGKG